VDEIEQETRAVAERWFEEIWNRRNPATARELWGRDFIGFMEGLPPLALEDFLGFQSQLLGAFSDLRIHIQDIVVDGDRAVVDWKLTGTHDGPLVGIPPSGREIEEYGLTKFRVERGKVVEGRDSWNFGSMLDRLARPSIRTLVERHGLTRRQAEVALLLADRRSTKEIAKRLDVRLNTARRHVQAVLRRLGLNGRDEVADAIGKVDIAPSGPHSPNGAA